jgi:hypothetical protein
MSNKNAVFVLDTVARGAERHYNPCNPVHLAAARKLLSHGFCAVFRQDPLQNYFEGEECLRKFPNKLIDKF